MKYENEVFATLTDEDPDAVPERVGTLLPESLEDRTDESPGLAVSMQARILVIHSSFSAMFSALR